MNASVRKYLAEMGRKGGLKSRRNLSAEDAKEMIRIREAKRAFKKFYAQCFWSYNPKYSISKIDVPWIADELKKHGGREAWKVGVRLCR
jgi:hypothetical protein